MASDKDIRSMVDDHLIPFFEEGLPKIIEKLENIESALNVNQGGKKGGTPKKGKTDD